MSIFQVKPIADLIRDSESGGLKRSLGRLNLISLGVGCTIGAGIFVLTGQVAAQYAGPAVVLSLVISAIACVFAGLCYAELSAMIPVSGSAYTYSYAALGEIFAWMIGWNLILEYLLGASTVAVGWSGYISSFLHEFNLSLPLAISKAPLTYDHGSWDFSGSMINLPAVIAIGILTCLLLLGIKSSATFNNFVVGIKITVILLFVFIGMAYINTDHWTPLIPANKGHFGEFGWSGVFRGAAVVFFAYVGFDAVSTAALEARKPQRDIPVGILGALVIVTLLYIAVALVMIGIVPFQQLNVPAPIAVAVDSLGPSLTWLRIAVKVGAIAGLTSVMLVLLLGQTRVLFAMAKDGLLPPIVSKVNKRYNTPHFVTIICGAFAALLAGIFPISILGDMVSIGTLFAFAMVCLGVLILRRKRPDLHRPFRVRWAPLLPILGMICTVAQMGFLPPANWIRLLVWVAIGLVIYFAYGYHNSKLRNK